METMSSETISDDDDQLQLTQRPSQPSDSAPTDPLTGPSLEYVGVIASFPFSSSLVPIPDDQPFRIGREDLTSEFTEDHMTLHVNQSTDQPISRRHATIIALPNGSAVITHLSSSMPTVVNGHALKLTQSQVLYDDDKIDFGVPDASFRFTFRSCQPRPSNPVSVPFPQAPPRPPQSRPMPPPAPQPQAAKPAPSQPPPRPRTQSAKPGISIEVPEQTITLRAETRQSFSSRLQAEHPDSPWLPAITAVGVAMLQSMRTTAHLGPIRRMLESTLSALLSVATPVTKHPANLHFITDQFTTASRGMQKSLNAAQAHLKQQQRATPPQQHHSQQPERQTVISVEQRLDSMQQQLNKMAGASQGGGNRKRKHHQKTEIRAFKRHQRDPRH